MEKQQDDVNESYNKAKHLQKVKEDLQRKNEFRKAQSYNKKMLSVKKLESKDDQDYNLVKKVGLPDKTATELAYLQEQLPIGGNLYFELNRIAYQRDIERRRKQIQQAYEYTLHHSPIKNHALAYGHEREKKLQEIEDKVINRNMRSNLPL